MDTKYKVLLTLPGMTPILSKDYWTIYQFNELVLPRFLRDGLKVEYEFIPEGDIRLEGRYKGLSLK